MQFLIFGDTPRRTKKGRWFFVNINTQQMRYFMELAKCLNFTKAAANLYVAQPTLSQQIAELESQLGVTLFNRNSRNVTLTPAGKILQEAYPSFEAQLEQVQQHMRITAAGFSGAVTIGFLENFVDIIPPVIREFKADFPDIVVIPVNGSVNKLFSGLKDKTMDILLSVIPEDFQETQSDFASRVFLRDHLCFVLSEDHPVPLDFSFVSSLPLITFSEGAASGYHDQICDCLKRQGLRAPTTYQVDSPRDIQVHLESGLGFSVLPSKLAPLFSAHTQFIPIPGEHLDFGILWDPHSTNPTMPLLLDTLTLKLCPDPEPGISP